MSFAQKNPPYKYVLKIDCAGSDLKNTGTKDDIMVEFFKKDGTSIKRLKLTDLQNSSCESNMIDDANFELNFPNRSLGGYGVLYNVFGSLNYRISYFTIENTGDDAFWLDQVILFRWDKRWGATFLSTEKADKVYRWGRTNGNGWCLSTDPNDSNGGFKNNITSTGCRPCFRFNLTEQKAYRCN